MGTILVLKNSTTPIEATGGMVGPRVRRNILGRTRAVFDFERQLSQEGVDGLTTGSVASMLPKQSDATVAGSFSSIIASKGLRLTAATTGEILELPSAFRLNWEADPSYMISFWYTNIAPHSTATFSPFIGWANTNSDFRWSFGPWGVAENNTLIIEDISVNYGSMSATVGVPQLVTAFIKRTGDGTCRISCYRGADLLISQNSTYRADPSGAAGAPRIGRMPGMGPTYSGVVHAAQVAQIPDAGINDEAGWVLAEYEAFKDQYTA